MLFMSKQGQLTHVVSSRSSSSRRRNLRRSLDCNELTLNWRWCWIFMLYCFELCVRYNQIESNEKLWYGRLGVRRDIRGRCYIRFLHRALWILLRPGLPWRSYKPALWLLHFCFCFALIPRHHCCGVQFGSISSSLGRRCTKQFEDVDHYLLLNFIPIE